MCRPKHVEQLRNTGIINSSTWLHLVVSFYEIYISNLMDFNTELEAGWNLSLMQNLAILISFLDFNLETVINVEDVIVCFWQSWLGLIIMFCVYYRRISMDNHYRVHREFLFTPTTMTRKTVTFLKKNQNPTYKIRKFSQKEMCHKCKVGQKDINRQQTVLYS